VNRPMWRAVAVRTRQLGRKLRVSVMTAAILAACQVLSALEALQFGLPDRRVSTSHETSHAVIRDSELVGRPEKSFCAKESKS
jgi:hypothetical protein